MKRQVLSEQVYAQYVDQYGYNASRVGMGAEAIQELLADIDLEKDSEELTAELETASGQKEINHEN